MRRSQTVGKHADNGKRIYEARSEKGLTQMQVCELVPLSHRQYVRLENGEHLPSGPMRDRLAAVLGVDRLTIKSGDDNPEEAADLGEPFRGNGSRGSSARSRPRASKGEGEVAA